ncbi:hypothetical protein Pla108_31070 [Botrimarina colliarenosi]|uniref:Uncharacterized protein n=1 Tax=Botrimarina colliarenosi TaxID=2528001 RepID=A0A5C6A9B4_9BACT|nr:alpha/beta hydrolase-fold protein [Botrimarina colliarenosi]TWT96026.1 hypothetical protein Pla108_31070 [Botrimarina colliarenosi]
MHRSIRFLAIVAVLAAVHHRADAQDWSNSVALTYSDGLGNTLPYRLFLPPGHDAPDASFPLVLHLHGSGERGSNNSSQLAYINGLIEATRTEHPAFLLVPQAPLNTRWDAFGSPNLSLPSQMTVDLIAQIEQQYAVDTSRRYATGLSLGGFGTWDLIGKMPSLFSKAFPLSGYGDPSRANDYLQTPVWTFHGSGDGTVPVVPKRQTVQAIRDAGGDPLYTEVLGGHGIWTPVYDDPNGELYDWVFDGVAPKLVDWQYDPNTGTVRIDARQAPGGVVSIFNLSVNQLDAINVPANVVIDGVVTPTTEVLRTSRISVDYNDPEGFDGVMEIPGLLPTGLDFLSLSAITSRQFYFSPDTGTNRRFFNLTIVEIPEPVGALLALVGVGAATVRRR